MTCELFDGPCDECMIQYCPDQIEELNMEYYDLKKAVEQAAEDLEDAQTELDEFYEEHKEILIQL